MMMMMTGVYPTTKKSPASPVAGGSLTKETGCNNYNGLEVDGEFTNNDGPNDIDDTVLKRSCSQLNTSAVGRRRQNSGKNAEDRHAEAWSAVAGSTWKDDVMLTHSGTDSEEDVEELERTQGENVTHPERKDFDALDDDVDCGCWNDGRCTTTEVRTTIPSDVYGD